MVCDVVKLIHGHEYHTGPSDKIDKTIPECHSNIMGGCMGVNASGVLSAGRKYADAAALDELIITHANGISANSAEVKESYDSIETSGKDGGTS